MLDYSFIPHIDNFEYTSGHFPVLITVDHAGFSKQGLQDIAVPVLLHELAGEFYVIENRVDRSIIDMNRGEARLNDEKDENDYFYRQIIRFICEIMEKNYFVKPIVIDLHSFSDHPMWGNPDLVLLDQTKKGMRTNLSLLCYTKDFFSKRSWVVNTSSFHNQDDVVEELAQRRLAIPILIEINETILPDKSRFSTLVADFKEYLQEVVSLNHAQSFPDAGARFPIELESLSRESIESQLKLLPQVKSLKLRKRYGEYLQLLSKFVKSNPISQSQTGDGMAYPTLTALGEDAGKISDKGSDDGIIIQYIIELIAQNAQSIIIPIELIMSYLKILYATINKTEYMEWSLSTPVMVNIICHREDLITPKFPNDLYAERLTCFKSYKTGDNFLNFVIVPKFASQFDISKDESFLQNVINPRLIDSVIKPAINRAALGIEEEKVCYEASKIAPISFER